MESGKKKHLSSKVCLREWGFCRNPFAEDLSPRELWAGSRKHIEYLQYLLTDINEEGGVITLLIIGEYGSGKTSHLLALRDFAIRELDGFVVYLTMPSRIKGRGYQEFLSVFVQAIGSEVIIDLGNEILKKQDIQNAEEFKQFLRMEGIDQDLGKALSNLVFKRSISLTWAWLTGRATGSQAKALDLQKNTSNDYTSLKIISGLLDYLSLNYRFIAILLDELEHLQSRSRRFEYDREGLGDIYDVLFGKERVANIAVVFASTAKARYEIDKSLLGTLSHRIDEEIVLKSFSENEIDVFVRDLFSASREDGSDNISPPFENKGAYSAFIHHVMKPDSLTGRAIGITSTPRRIIRKGRTLLLRSCSRGIKTISRKHITGLLDEAGGVSE